MSFGIDHPLIAVNDLAKARSRAQALGFCVAPHYSHPWGTENELLLFDTTFIELIAITRPDLTGYVDANGFRFARAIEARLTHGEGVAMVALDSQDMAEDHAMVEARGFAPWAPIEFERKASSSGQQVDVRVALDILHDPAQPFLTQFLCQQLNPDLLRPHGRGSTHANQVSRLAKLWYVSDNLERDIAHFRAIHGADRIVQIAGGYRITTDKGDFWLLTPAALSDHLGTTSHVAPAPPRVVAIGLETLDLKAAMACWDTQDVPYERVGEYAAEVPASFLGGTLLRFEQCEDCLL